MIIMADMTKTEIATQGIATVLCNLPADTPGRHDLFVRAIESLLRHAITERELMRLQSVQSDLQRVGEIQRDSREY